jgi:hypothetical protein
MTPPVPFGNQNSESGLNWGQRAEPLAEYRQAAGAIAEALTSTREGGNIGDGSGFYWLADRGYVIPVAPVVPVPSKPPSPATGATLSRSNMSAFEARRIAANIAKLPGATAQDLRPATPYNGS